MSELHYAMSLGCVYIQEAKTTAATPARIPGTYNVSLLPPPVFVRPVGGMVLKEEKIVNNLVLHAGVDPKGNIVAVLRAGPVKIGPFYHILTASPLIINLGLYSTLQTGGQSDPMLTGSIEVSLDKDKKSVFYSFKDIKGSLALNNTGSNPGLAPLLQLEKAIV